MKNLSKITIAVCGTMTILFSACQTDELTNNANDENKPHVYHVTASANQSQGAAPSRALSVDPDNGRRLISEWAANDGLVAFINGDEGTLEKYSILLEIF